MGRVTSKTSKPLVSLTADPSLTRNIVALRKGLVLASSGVASNEVFAASLQAELMQLGFILDKEAFQAVSSSSSDWIKAYFSESISYLRKKLGADRSYTPFYRNFPKQVMEMSHFDLFINAIVHYWSGGTWEPPQELKERGIHFENTDFKVIRLGDESEFKNLFSKIVSINQSLTEEDKSIVAWFIDNYGAENLPLPVSIPFKETLCILAAKQMNVPVTDVTDVLRVAVYLSGGDLSLPSTDPEPFRNFKRSERRFLMELLSRTNLSTSDMQRKAGRWIRLGEKLHPGEFANKYPKVVEAFRQVREQPVGDASVFTGKGREKLRTFNGSVDLAFARSFRSGIDVLATRPGEFARRVDWMLRTEPREADHILSTFHHIGGKISSKVLFEMHAHFERRLKADAPRTIRLKSKRAKMKVLPSLPALPVDMVEAVQETVMAVLTERVAKQPKLGKVWIDERLKDVPVPFSMRSINAGVKTYVRGTRIPFRADAEVIRPFIHWFDEEGNEDLDLSAGLYDENLVSVAHISWTCLKELGCCHSGDIRQRKGPCAEYVDIPVKKVLERGVRYALIQVYNYQQRPMHTLKDCVFGLMERENAVANEIFVPKTISNCIGLANEGNSVTVCIIDLLKHEYIWADTESDSLPTLESSRGVNGNILVDLIKGSKMSVYDLLLLHAKGRGQQVKTAAEADVKFVWEEMVTDYAKVAQYMTI